MEPTQAFDPNRTAMQPNVGATQAMPVGVAGPAPAVSIEVLAGRDVTMANGPAREQFVVNLVGGAGAPGFGGTARTPLNLCLVIDRSGSMEGPPLEYVKQACEYVVDLLSPQDVLSIVTFEERVDVLMPPQRVTNKAPIKQGISQLTPGNTTDLYGGLALGLQQVLTSPETGRSTRLVVFSDGEPTTGVKDFAALVQHAGDIRTRGVTCTFLGFGAEYNEELLAAMAKKAGGNYYYIPRPELIPEVFRTELEKLMTVVARNVSLDLQLARWVTLRGATGLSAGSSDRRVELKLADIERGEVLQQVFDFEFSNHPLGHYRVAGGRLAYEDCVAGAQKTVDLDFVIEFSADAARYSQPVRPEVAQAAQVAAAGRTVEKTVMGLKTGQLSGQAAVAELQKTQALLLKDGRISEAQEVTMALRALQSGDSASAEKTLMGAVVRLDQGKRQQ